jgi:hypothetical protein
MWIAPLCVRRLVFCRISFLFAAGAAHLNAQAVSQISGIVIDSFGASIPSIQITAIQTDTGTQRTVATDSSGSYLLTNLRTGPYRIEAAKDGCRSYQQNAVILQVDSAPVISVTLTVGEISTKVEVEANATQVETRNMAGT